MAKKLRAGTFRTEIPEEEVLWRDRKRWLFLGLPWTFTTYTLTDTKLRLGKGFWKKTEDDIMLYRITDVTFFQTFWERLAGLGTLCIMSSDMTNPEAHLIHIKKARKVKDFLIQKVEEARKRSGVYTSEIVGLNTPHPGGGEHPDYSAGEGGKPPVPPAPPEAGCGCACHTPDAAGATAQHAIHTDPVPPAGTPS